MTLTPDEILPDSPSLTMSKGQPASGEQVNEKGEVVTIQVQDKAGKISHNLPH